MYKEQKITFFVENQNKTAYNNIIMNSSHWPWPNFEYSTFSLFIPLHVGGSCQNTNNLDFAYVVQIICMHACISSVTETLSSVNRTVSTNDSRVIAESEYEINRVCTS